MTVARWEWFTRRPEGTGVRYVAAGAESSDCRKVAWLEMANPLRAP
jgi:hypothetical protein